MSLEITGNEEDVKYGFMTSKYQKWRLDFPKQVASFDKLGGPHPSEYLSVFAEISPDIFNSVFETENDEILKNVETSANFRNQGNSEYQKKSNASALQSYTNALLFAEEGSEAMALAFANRSAVLASLGEHSAALRDISRALNNNYPKHLNHKLFERKAKCLVGVKLYEDAIKAFEEAEQNLEQSTLAADKKEQLLSDWKTQKSSAEKLAAASPGGHKSTKFMTELFCKKHPRYKSKVPKLTNPNPRFPSFSNSVQVVRNDEVGRHVIASRDIRAGELVAVEDPIVSRLNGGQRGKNCSYCFDVTTDFLPSPITNKDVFCSESCLAEAMASFHPVEASFNHIIATMETVRTEWFLALRAITQKPLQYFLERAEDFSEHQPNYGADENTKDDFVYDSADYKSIFNLVVLHDKWGAAEHQFRAFVTFFFIKCLRQANYFHSKISNGESNTTQNGELTKEEQLIGSILVHLMSVASLNCFATGIYQAAQEVPWHQGIPMTLGSTYQHTLALLNHSCDPNVIRYNIAQSNILVANRDILKGQEVTDCYYSNYAELAITERKIKLLSKYRFECICQACQENWPMHMDLPKGFNDGKILVPLEEFPSAMAAIQKLGSAISLEQKVENYQKLITLYIEFIKLLQKTIAPPHAFYFMTQMHLYKCFWILNGSKIRLDQK